MGRGEGPSPGGGARARVLWPVRCSCSERLPPTRPQRGTKNFQVFKLKNVGLFKVSFQVKHRSEF